jgi:hypothetical protein
VLAGLYIGELHGLRAERVNLLHAKADVAEIHRQPLSALLGLDHAMAERGSIDPREGSRPVHSQAG